MSCQKPPRRWPSFRNAAAAREAAGLGIRELSPDLLQALQGDLLVALEKRGLGTIWPASIRGLYGRSGYGRLLLSNILWDRPLSCDKPHSLRRHFLHHLPTPRPYLAQYLDMAAKIFFGAICASHLLKSASAVRKRWVGYRRVQAQAWFWTIPALRLFKRCLKGDYKE